MIATGLIFLLGALVALLFALLFIPLLWRNAQRLARRDYAATMPATMSEIRAEVDRVRAETAMVVRRHEMLAQKAREQVAVERAAVGRLSAANAKMAFQSDQHVGEANALRGQIETAQARIEALKTERLRLEEESADLKEAIEEAIAEARELEAQAEADRLVVQDDESVEDDAGSSRETKDAARVAAATAALLAIAREQRKGRDGDPAAQPLAGDAGTRTAPSSTAGSAGFPDHQQAVVDELSALATAPRPTDPVERERQNARVRERMADVAARVIQRATLSEGAGSRTADLLAAPAPSSPNGTVTLADRVRRLAEPRTSTPEAEAPLPQSQVTDATVELAAERVNPTPTRAKRRRGATQSRPRSPR